MREARRIEKTALNGGKRIEYDLPRALCHNLLRDEKWDKIIEELMQKRGISNILLVTFICK
jgi:hypothetical protein